MSPPTLAIVVPTLDAGGNVAELVRRLRGALACVSWEVVFVDDDSRDHTRDVIRALTRSDVRIRLVHRLGRTGLGSVCVESWLATTAPYVALMDADLQHDERLLPRRLALLERGAADLAVASRYAADRGSVGEWDAGRAGFSCLVIRLASTALELRVRDPMIGFVMLRRDVLEARVRPRSVAGFKVLLDLLPAGPPPRDVELP